MDMFKTILRSTLAALAIATVCVEARREREVAGAACQPEQCEVVCETPKTVEQTIRCCRQVPVQRTVTEMVPQEYCVDVPYTEMCPTTKCKKEYFEEPCAPITKCRKRKVYETIMCPKKEKVCVTKMCPKQKCKTVKEEYCVERPPKKRCRTVQCQVMCPVQKCRKEKRIRMVPVQKCVTDYKTECTTSKRIVPVCPEACEVQ